MDGLALAVLFALVILAVLTVILLFLLLFRGRRAPVGEGAGGTGAGDTTPPGTGTGTGEPSGTTTPAIPDALTPAVLTDLIRARLAGSPSDGSSEVTAEPTEVIWVDNGDELLVHLDGTTTEIVDDCVIVSLDLECDQTGRTPLVVVFSLGQDGVGMIAATDQIPRGNGILVARWAAVVQAAAWSCLVSIATEHATERNLAPGSVVVRDGALHLSAAEPVSIA